jgi:hypothetical protein
MRDRIGLSKMKKPRCAGLKVFTDKVAGKAATTVTLSASRLAAIGSAGGIAALFRKRTALFTESPVPPRSAPGLSVAGSSAGALLPLGRPRPREATTKEAQLLLRCQCNLATSQPMSSRRIVVRSASPSPLHLARPSRHAALQRRNLNVPSTDLTTVAEMRFRICVRSGAGRRTGGRRPAAGTPAFMRTHASRSG